MSEPYLLGYRRVEQERLERQSVELAAESEWLFEQVGVTVGWRVVEVGCGPRGCLELLARRVGARGAVVGLGRSREQAATAARFVAETGLANVEIRHADARSAGLPSESFDLVTARLVLVNVPEPQQLLGEMVRLARPGGVIALHEPDASTQRCDPPHAAWSRALELLRRYGELHAIDRTIGVRLPRMLRAAGVIDVQTRALVHAYPVDHPQRMLVSMFLANVADRLLAERLIDRAELDAVQRELRTHLEDPETLILSPVFVQAWGRMSAHA